MTAFTTRTSLTSSAAASHEVPVDHAARSELCGGPAPHLAIDDIPSALEVAAAERVPIVVAKGDAEPEPRTYHDVQERARLVAATLRGRGLRRGDRVLLMLPTSDDWLATFFGILLAGGVAVPLGPTFSFGGVARFAETIRHIAVDSGARFLVATAAVVPYLDELRRGSVLEDILLRESLFEAVQVPVPLPAASGDDVAILQYTSGTSGKPKGVMLTHRALLTNARMIGARVGATSQDVGVSWLPLFHDMGLVGALFTSLAFRNSLLLMPVESFLMQPRRWLSWASRRRASMIVAPNFAYQLVADRSKDADVDKLDLSALRCAFDGAEPVRPATLRAFEQRFGRTGLVANALQPVYGMAENSLAATFPAIGARWSSETLCQGASTREIASVGTPLDGVRVRVVDGDGRPVRHGVVGDVLLSSPSLMRGYFRDDEATARALDRGWLRTGDLGFVQRGELFVTGRAKELIIKRGTNYHPEEIEQVVLSAAKDSVTRVVAFGCSDEAAGTEQLIVVYETSPGSTHERDQLERTLQGELIGAIGTSADVLVHAPSRTIELTTSGKVRRSAARARYLAGELSPQVGRPS